MKVKVPQSTDIIVLPQNFAVLDNISNITYNYVVSYTIDVIKALKNKVTYVEISVYKQRPVTTTIPVLTTVNNPVGLSSLSFGGVTKSVLTRNSLIKDTIRTNNTNALLVIKSDYTAWIPNDKTTEITQATKNIGNTNIVQQRDFVATQLQTLVNTRPSVLETPLSTLQPTQTNIDPQSVSYELINNFATDPASLLVKQNVIMHAQSVHGGFAANVSKPKSTLLGDALINDLNNTGRTTKPNTLSLPKESFVVQPTVTVSSIVQPSERLEIPIDLIGATEFYIKFSLKTSLGVSVQETTQMVDHGKNVTVLSTPTIPPTVNSRVSKLGVNIFEVTQKDSKAIGVNIYRKNITKSQFAGNNDYKFIGKVPLTTRDGAKKVEDNISNLNPTIYRVVPYGQNNALGAEFGSVVVAGQREGSYIKVDRLERNKFISLSYEINTLGIQITIKSIPTNVCSIELYKQDMSLGHAPKFVTSPIFVGTNSTFVINDNDLIANRVYRYFVNLIYRDGAKVAGSNELFIEYTPEKTNIVETRILGQQTVQNGNSLDVQFQIQSNLILTDEDVLKKALEDQGLISYYSSEITKENLQSLIAYRIIRTNITTGEVEDFGIVNNANFSDIELGTVRGVNPPQDGCEYDYAVITYLRSSDSALQGVETTVTDTTYPAKSYTYQPWFWHHPVTLSDGNLISTNSLQRIYAKTQFSFGEVGKITHIRMSLTKIVPTVYEAKALKVNKKTIRLLWRVQGSVAKIDHFIVMMEVLGMRTVVGKCHNISETNSFEFVDILTNNEKGELNYIIIPVLYDYNRGKEVQTNKVLV